MSFPTIPVASPPSLCCCRRKKRILHRLVSVKQTNTILYLIALPKDTSSSPCIGHSTSGEYVCHRRRDAIVEIPKTSLINTVEEHHLRVVRLADFDPPQDGFWREGGSKDIASGQVHLTAKTESDPRFVFEFEGKLEFCPLINQLQGSMCQPISFCKFSHNNATNRCLHSRSLQIERKAIPKKIVYAMLQ